MPSVIISPLLPLLLSNQNPGAFSILLWATYVGIILFVSDHRVLAAAWPCGWDLGLGVLAAWIPGPALPSSAGVAGPFLEPSVFSSPVGDRDRAAPASGEVRRVCAHSALRALAAPSCVCEQFVRPRKEPLCEFH